MKLLNYLTENISYDKDVIRKDCAIYLKELKEIGFNKNNLFVRGMYLPTDVIKKTVRKDRYPRDTKIHLSTLMDNYFQKEFGFKARSESVFCYKGKGSSAAIYGELYYILPVGNFDVLYNPNIKDLTVDLNNTKETFKLSSVIKYEDSEEIEKELQDHWKGTSQEDAFNRQVVQFTLQSFPQLVSVFDTSKNNDLLVKPYREWKEKVLKEKVDGYKKVHNTIPHIEYDRELMIHCDEYYTFAQEFFNDIEDLLV